MATRKDSNSAALAALKSLGVDIETVTTDVPPVGALVGHIDSPFSLIVPPGMESLADPAAGRVLRVVDERQVALMEARGCHRIDDKRVHFRGMAPGSGVYLFQPKHVADAAREQRKQIDAGKQPRRRKRTAGQPIPLPVPATEGGTHAARTSMDQRWVPVARPGGEG